MRESPLFSIIVPVYNVEAYVDECVMSIVTQDYDSFEVILIDDGSSDESPSICDNWANRDLRIKVIHKVNGGLSDARNTGIDAASGDFVWFVDSDDSIADGILRKVADCISNYPEVDVISTNIITYVDGSEKPHDDELADHTRTIVVANSSYVLNHYPVLPSVRFFIRRCLLQNNNLRFIKGVLHEDIPFCHMLMGLCKIIVRVPEISYYYRLRSGSITSTSQIRSCYSLIESHKQIKKFIESEVAENDKVWLWELTYDYFYEVFLRIYPFDGKKEYCDFMKIHGHYVKEEFWKLRHYLKGKRLMLLYLFHISPRWYSRLIYTKRMS